MSLDINLIPLRYIDGGLRMVYCAGVEVHYLLKSFEQLEKSFLMILEEKIIARNLL